MSGSVGSVGASFEPTETAPQTLSQAKSEHQTHTSVRTCAIVGGTHGNELTGVALVGKWRRLGTKCLSRPSVNAFTLLGNPAAVLAESRYVDCDLNRCFSPTILRRPCSIEDGPAEEARAKVLALELTARGAQLCLDLHNTTSSSNCLIVSRANDLFALHCALAMASAAGTLGYELKLWMPAEWAQPHSWAECPEPIESSETKSSPFANVGSVAPSDIGIELGPQPHGVLHAWTVELAQVLVDAALDFCEDFNSGKCCPQSDNVEIFSLSHAVPYPDFDFESPASTAAPGQRLRTIIHPRLQGSDFSKLNPCDEAFVQLDTGDTISYGGDACHPVFVNEAAYLSRGTAFYACTRHVISLPSLSCSDP
eukprot:m.53816 g.53816  ORF g.53816 m.53816 type:complete len:367 (+) comp9168_c0_seq1:113-1213(+)